MDSKAVGVWVLAVALAAVFVIAGVPKLIAQLSPIVLLGTIGYPGWFRILIGIVETAAGIGLLVPRVATWAAALLGLEMIGAIATYAIAGPLDAALGPVIIIVLLAILAWLRRPHAA